MERKNKSPHDDVVKKCYQFSTNLKVTQSIQHGIAYTVLVVLKAHFRRDGGRGGRPFYFRHVIRGNYRASHLSQIGKQTVNFMVSWSWSSHPSCTDMVLDARVTHAHSAHQPSVAASHIQSLSMFFFRSVTMSRLPSPLRRSNFDKDSAEGSIFLSKVPTPSCHTLLYHDIWETNEGGRVPMNNPSQCCPFLVKPYVIQDPLVTSRNLKLAAMFLACSDRQTERSTLWSHKHPPLDKHGPDKLEQEDTLRTRQGCGARHSRRPCLVNPTPNANCVQKDGKIYELKHKMYCSEIKSKFN